MHRKSEFLTAFPLLLLSLLPGCGGKADQLSNLTDTTSADAKKSFESRLVQTAKLKETLQAIEKVLKPLDSTLRDITRILGSENARLRTELPHFAVSELRHILHSLENHLVVQQPDGSWNAEQEIAWPFERQTSNGSACARTQVGITAIDSRTNDKAQDAEVYLNDCSLGFKTVIATVHLGADGNTSVKFASNLAQRIRDQSIVTEACTLELSAMNSTGLVTCKPFQETFQSVTVSFSTFQYAMTRAGETMNLTLCGYRADGGKIADLVISQVPGEPIQTKLNRVAQP